MGATGAVVTGSCETTVQVIVVACVEAPVSQVTVWLPGARPVRTSGLSQVVSSVPSTVQRRLSSGASTVNAKSVSNVRAGGRPETTAIALAGATVYGEVQAAHAPASTLHSAARPGALGKVKVGVESLLEPAAAGPPEIVTGSVGAVVSTVQDVVDVLVLPAVSRASIVAVWSPVERPVKVAGEPQAANDPESTLQRVAEVVPSASR